MSSGGGGVEATRRSASPGLLKRKRELSHPRDSSSLYPKAPKLANTFTSSSLVGGVGVNGRDPVHYRSPDSDEMHHSDSGDTLRGIGSASSLTSTASSVFSSNSHAFAQNRTSSLANGLTPLTSHSDSSPPKIGSPPSSAKTMTVMASTNGTSAVSHMLASQPPQQQRPQMLPPPGKAKGYRVVWDPELDGKLSREERKRATLRKRDFGTEVRYILHNLLSLRNMLNITCLG